MQGIQIRKWTLQDRDALVAIFAAADRRFLSDRLPDPYTEKDADFWLRRVCEQDGAAGIFRAVTVDDVVAGSVSIEQKEDVYRKDADIGYFLVGAQWSKGIMTEAVRQACDAAFRQLDIVRITGAVYAPNLASRRVLEKNGFTLEGTLRSGVFKDGRLQDLCLYGKLKGPDAG